LPLNTMSVVAATDGPISLGKVAVPLQLHVQPPLDVSSALLEPAVAQTNSATNVAALATTVAEPCSLLDRKEGQQPWIEQGTEEPVRNTAVVTDTELLGKLAACTVMFRQEVDDRVLRAQSPNGGAQQDLPYGVDTKQEEAKPEKGSKEPKAKQETFGKRDGHAEQEVAEQENIHREACEQDEVEQPRAVQGNAEQQIAHLETVAQKSTEWEMTKQEMADQKKAMHDQQHGTEEESGHQDSACIRTAQEEAEQQTAERERAEREKAEREKEVLELRMQKAMLQGHTGQAWRRAMSGGPQQDVGHAGQAWRRAMFEHRAE